MERMIRDLADRMESVEERVAHLEDVTNRLEYMVTSLLNEVRARGMVRALTVLRSVILPFRRRGRLTLAMGRDQEDACGQIGTGSSIVGSSSVCDHAAGQVAGACQRVSRTLGSMTPFQPEPLASHGLGAGWTACR
ncbi:hypothetical protein IHE45_11G087100 [Dioscorea alata]|uniref:Uncharacterized protein n=1 Tax=Dioscorea alata TaxID=55571 RepID=A0ACB7V7T8_DIOAL|nr:hypothetical protein IHE45_11G087100 [Dioscorea alata]